MPDWVRDGHKVTVVTCTPNHPDGRPYPGYRNRFWQTEVMDGIHVIRIWTFLAANEGVTLRTLNQLSYLLMVTLVVPWLPRAEIVISTSPPLFCGLAGYGISRIKRARWLLEVRDLWPDAIRAVGAIRNRWLIRTPRSHRGLGLPHRRSGGNRHPLVRRAHCGARRA